MMCLVKGSTSCKYPISIDLKNKILSYKTSTAVKESDIEPKVKKNEIDETVKELSKIFFRVIDFLILRDYGKNILHKNILEKYAFSEFYIDDFENGVLLDNRLIDRKNIKIIDSHGIKFFEETFQTRLSTITEYRDLVRDRYSLRPLGLVTQIRNLNDSDKINIFLEYCFEQVYYITKDLNTIISSQNFFKELSLQNFFQSVCEVIYDLDSEFLKKLCKYIVLIRRPISGNIFSIPQVSQQKDRFLKDLLHLFDEKGGEIYSGKDLNFLSYILNLNIPNTIEVKKSINIDEKTYKSNLNELNVAVSLLKNCSENPMDMTMIRTLKDYKMIGKSETKLLSMDNLRFDVHIASKLKNYFNRYFIPNNNFKERFPRKKKIYFSFEIQKNKDEIQLTLMKTEIVKTTKYTYSVGEKESNIIKIYQLKSNGNSVNCKLYDYLFKDPNGVRLLYNSHNGISQREFSNIISNIDHKNFDGKNMLIDDTTNVYLIIGDFSKKQPTTINEGNIYFPIMTIYSDRVGDVSYENNENNFFYTKNNNITQPVSSSLKTYLDNFEYKNFSYQPHYNNVFSFYDFVNEKEDKIQLNSYFYNDEKNPGECIIAHNNIKKLTYLLPYYVENQTNRRKFSFFKSGKNDTKKLNIKIREDILKALPELIPIKVNKNPIPETIPKVVILDNLQRIIDGFRIGDKFKLDEANLNFVKKNEEIRPTVNISVSLTIYPFNPENIDSIVVQLGERRVKQDVREKKINFDFDNIQLKTDMSMKINFSKKTNGGHFNQVGSCKLNQTQWTAKSIKISNSAEIDVITTKKYTDHLDEFVSEYFQMYNDTETAAKQLYIYLLYREYMKNRKDMNNSIFVKKYPQIKRKGLANKMSNEDEKRL
jgi:hypothetical protein